MNLVNTKINKLLIQSQILKRFLWKMITVGWINYTSTLINFEMLDCNGFEVHFIYMYI